mmetsp:Transcript_50005/g.60386  ORF Transcript_50005/g.60386 Transcript_50005/m.60386 type:complete len:119 (+) Transcript_50005:49-405(+)
MKNFSVYRKPNQKLKYVPANSTHMRATLRAIPTGVLLCLARLTSPSLDNADRPINTIYPNHANALCMEHLSPKTFPTLAQLWEEEADRQLHKKRWSTDTDTPLEDRYCDPTTRSNSEI